ncbi:STM4012 family radical SAM protein [Plantactinospora endophytica]|uniref:Heme chaperone HemW n=1 Tax=Plantactinospora endophytica TaxID=673535 RepID=A0ABQ4E593_9ACTN|nr:STM4012 family radical SAM protein [Plantactinospora endophytica]GIG89875.1 coproporphyrinogen III oxidase [Plantactinospora endophytica]
MTGSLDGSPYQGYLYAYPHKTAYRPLRPRPALREVWAEERRDALFLYLHVPFCEMRCGFCNLFTRSNPPAEQVSGYLGQLARQADRVRAALGDDVGYARVAVGGGTPTYLDPAELSAMFDVLAGFGARLGAVPMAVETSPATATPDRIGVLAERGTTRVSIGVQSFLDTEARAAGRPQHRTEVERALDTIRAYDIPELNLDLIYGIPGQTATTWAESISSALRWRPEELFLYPLYVRPLTGLGRRSSTVETADPAWDAQRLALYRQGRDLLRAAGYRQLSLRHFRRTGLTHGASRPTIDNPDRTELTGDDLRPTMESPRRTAPTGDGPRPTVDTSGQGGPDYCCQDDGMVGLGCGARSYTADLHYSFDYAVGVRHVRTIVEDYLRRPATDFDVAEVGFRLDAVEQRRRWLVKSLLRADGFDPADYAARFGSRVDDDFPQLDRLAERGWLTSAGGRTALTETGLERSDTIGPWLVSGPVRRAMADYALR